MNSSSLGRRKTDNIWKKGDLIHYLWYNYFTTYLQYLVYWLCTIDQILKQIRTKTNLEKVLWLETSTRQQLGKPSQTRRWSRLKPNWYGWRQQQQQKDKNRIRGLPKTQLGFSLDKYGHTKTQLGFHLDQLKLLKCHLLLVFTKTFHDYPLVSIYILVSNHNSWAFIKTTV
jgi:hypothetical protein